MSQQPNVSNFRYSAKHLFATFPKCSLPKQDALDRINQLYPCEWALVAAEAHADGTPHLHCVIRFTRTYTTRNCSHFDDIAGQHGNYTAPRNIKAVLAYTQKDGDFITSGPVPTISDVSSTGRVSPSKAIADLIISGGSLIDCRNFDPGFYLTHVKFIKDLIFEVACEKLKLSLLPWPGVEVPETGSDCNKLLHKWLNKNVRKPREFKQPQLYLHGPPNIGKTSFVNTLSKYLSVYHLPTDEDFYDSYSDSTYDIVVLDEFKAQKRITWLNLFLQGGPMTLRKKGSQIQKLFNIPVIILSNYSLHEAYSNSSQLALSSLYARVEIIEWTTNDFISLNFAGLPLPDTLPDSPPGTPLNIYMEPDSPPTQPVLKRCDAGTTIWEMDTQ